MFYMFVLGFMVGLAMGPMLFNIIVNFLDYLSDNEL